jgi:uncharacterized membrane protein YjgN (DUF898 family)
MFDGVEGGGEPLKFRSALALKSFAWLSLKNGLLNLVTLTLYRFWGKTEVRRRVWRGVLLNDEPLEYTGRGVELFVGFLLAALIVGAPFLLIVFGAQFLPPLAAGSLVLLSYILLGFLYGLGTFTAFRYAASRTRWRGVRFRLRGSARDYGVIYLALAFLRGFSLGWATPAIDLHLAERLWGELTFGDRRFRWSRRSKANLYARFAIGWVAAVAAYAALIVGVGAVGLAASDGEEPPVELLLLFYPVVFGLFLLVYVAFTPYRAALMREVAGSLMLDEARFSLAVRSGPLLGLALTNILLLAFTLGFAAPFAQARTIRFMVDRLSAEGEVQLAAARQTEAGPAHGEGLADAFGIAPI